MPILKTKKIKMQVIDFRNSDGNMMLFDHISSKLLLKLFKRVHHIKLSYENILKMATELCGCTGLNNAFGSILNDILLRYYFNQEASDKFNGYTWSNTDAKVLFEAFLSYKLEK